MSLSTNFPSTRSRGTRVRTLVIPAQVRVVTQLARLDQMRDCEERAENDADSSYDHVCDAEEGVLATHYGTCRDDDGFRAAVFGYVEVCLFG